MSAKDADARLAAALDVRVRAGSPENRRRRGPGEGSFPSEGSTKDAAALPPRPKPPNARRRSARRRLDSTVRSYSASAIDSAVVAALRARVAFPARPRHGRRVRRAHAGPDRRRVPPRAHGWTPVARADALRRRRFFADDGVTPPRVYLKKRWSRDPGERGGARVVQSFEGIEGAAPEEEPRGTETEAEDFFVPLYDEAFAIDDGERSGEGAASVYSRVFASNFDAKTFRSLCGAALTRRRTPTSARSSRANAPRSCSRRPRGRRIVPPGAAAWNSRLAVVVVVVVADFLRLG